MLMFFSSYLSLQPIFAEFLYDISQPIKEGDVLFLADIILIHQVIRLER